MTVDEIIASVTSGSNTSTSVTVADGKAASGKAGSGNWIYIELSKEGSLINLKGINHVYIFTICFR